MTDFVEVFDRFGWTFYIPIHSLLYRIGRIPIRGGFVCHIACQGVITHSFLFRSTRKSENFRLWVSINSIVLFQYDDRILAHTPAITERKKRQTIKVSTTRGSHFRVLPFFNDLYASSRLGHIFWRREEFRTSLERRLSR